MPAQATDEAGVDKAAYYLALEGVTRYGLAEAVKAILQGALGHAFFPNPVELRQQCNRAMQWHERERERIARQEQIRRDRPPPIPQRTPEELARHKALMTRFYKSMGYEEGQKIAQERTPLDPELLAQIPDAPTTWRKIA